MSSSVGYNHSNGSSNVSGHPSNSSSRAQPTQNGITGGRASPGQSQATANGSSQDSNCPTTTSYTGLLSQNGNFGDHFWSVKNGSRNGNNTAGSEAQSRAVTGTKEDGGAANGEGDSRAGNVSSE